MLSALRLLCRHPALRRPNCTTVRTLYHLQKAGDAAVTASAGAAASTEPPAASSETESQLAESLQLVPRLIASCSSVQELLTVPSQRNLTLSDQLLLLTTVARCAARDGVAASVLTQHPWYQQLAEPRHGRSHAVLPRKLLSPVSALLDLQVPTTDPLLLSLLNDLAWNVRKMTIKQLLTMLDLVNRLRPPDGQTAPRVITKLREHTVSSLQQRWVEITSAEDIVSVLWHRRQFTEEFLSRLEDRALDVAAGIGCAQAGLILSSLAAAGRRPMPLIRSLTYHAARAQQPTALKDCVRLLHALHRLHYPDQILLEKLGRDLVPQVESVETAPALTAALTAAGLLRWRNCEFLEAASQWYLRHLESLSPQDMISVIITIATVNFSPNNADQLIPALVERCGVPVAPPQQLDLVWSLAALGRASESQLRAVLQPEFLRQLTAARPSAAAAVKVLNLAALARLQHGYTGPHTAQELGLPLPEGAPLQRPAAALKLRAAVLEVLQLLAPPPRHCNLQPPALGGVAPDAELCVDGAGAPVPLPVASAPAPPPPGLQRLVLCTWAFRDLTLDSVELTGYSQMAVRILELAGYQVLHVLHTDLRPEDTVVQRAKWLRQKIKDLAVR